MRKLALKLRLKQERHNLNYSFNSSFSGGLRHGGLRAVPSVGSKGKAPGGRSGSEASQPRNLMTCFVKICYFVTVFRRMHGCTNQFNMKWKKSTWRPEKSYGKQQCLPMTTGHRKWAGRDCPPCPIGSAPSGHVFGEPGAFREVAE